MLGSVVARRWATNISSGYSKNGRDSVGKRLGVKLGNGNAFYTVLGAVAKPNDIIVRQRGFKWHAGPNVLVGRDYTLHAAVPGRVVLKRDLDLQKTTVAVDPLVHPPLPICTGLVNHQYAMLRPVNK